PFNVGRSEENYRIREVADMVQQVVPDSVVKYAPGGGPDLRCYRVDCGKIARILPQFRPTWTVRKGIEQLSRAFKQHGLTPEAWTGKKFLRIKRIKELQSAGQLDGHMRWRTASPAAVAS